MTTTTDDTTQTHLLQLVHYAAHNAAVATSKRDAAICDDGSGNGKSAAHSPGCCR